MSGLQPYPEYVNTGVAFLGQIPAGWVLQPAVTLANVLTSTVDKHTAPGELPVRLCNYTDVYYNDFITDSSTFMTASATREQVASYSVEAGDVVFTKDSETADDIGIAAYVEQSLPGVVYGYHLSTYRPRDLRYGRFLKWLLGSRYAKATFETRTLGVTRVGLSQNTVRYFRVPTPSPEEADQIGKYLDRETAEIDAFIADQGQLIELLTERRAATISHAVTKGLDPAAYMKVSASDFFDNYPGNWLQHSLRHSLSFLTSGSRGWAEFYSDAGERFIRIGNLSRGTLDIDQSDMQFVRLPESVEGQRARTREGDLLFSITAYLGSVAVVEAAAADSYVSQHVALARPNPRHFDSMYLGYLALSEPLQNQLVQSAYGGTKVQLSLSDIGDLVVLRPALEDQRRIVAYLDHEIRGVDQTITDAREAIALSRERRAALISAAVTGKIDVRQHPSALPAHSEVA